MNNTKHRSPFAIAARLIVLVRPMLPIMLAAIVMVSSAISAPPLSRSSAALPCSRRAGLPSPLAGVGTAFVCILVFALLRGVLRYAEQASNHYIAFKLLALIRDKVFGALRRLTPAKLEGRDRGDLISLITADIEQLEVFYAHTISPVCIAILCVTGMTCFTASYHILPALVLLAGYLLVGIALPVWSARRGDKAAVSTGRPWPTPTAICWKACAACGISCSTRIPPRAPRASRPTARCWGRSRRP